MNQPTALPCNAAQLHRFGDLSTEHGPHEWVVQPGMPAVRCPGAPAVSSAGQAPATNHTDPPAVWIDGHPQLEAIAAAVWEQCRTEDSSLVVDDPRNIAVAALAAVLPAPTDPAATRADILAEAINAVRDGDLGPRDGMSRDYEDGWWNSRAAAEQRIRSLADSSTQPVTVVSQWHPMSEQLAEEMNEGSSLIQQWAARAAAEPTAGARQDGAES